MNPKHWKRSAGLCIHICPRNETITCVCNVHHVHMYAYNIYVYIVYIYIHIHTHVDCIYLHVRLPEDYHIIRKRRALL